MSCAVLVLMIYYSFKIKGVSGFMHELFFGSALAPRGIWRRSTLILNIIEYLAKAVSLGMRLFAPATRLMPANWCSCLIALLPSDLDVQQGSFRAGFRRSRDCWRARSIFHILIVLLQVFIFMMLTLVYIGQAHDHH